MKSGDYRERAIANAPRTVDELREAARQMAQSGLGEHTIAEALHLDVAAVRGLLGNCAGCES